MIFFKQSNSKSIFDISSSYGKSLILRLSYDCVINLHFEICHSYLTYGLPVWGFANQKLIDNIKLFKKKDFRLLNLLIFNAHIYPIIKK